MEALSFSQKIKIELIKLMYQQINFALWAESFAAIGVVVALWGVKSNGLLLLWLLFNLIICGLSRHVIVFQYKRAATKQNLNYQQMQVWLLLFTLGAFFSGISWGLTGSLLMVRDDLIRQEFIVFLLIGVTSAANAFYSPIRSIYAIFLIPAFVPFSIWLFYQGGIFTILGILAIIYMVIMIASSFYYHKLIYSSLLLRFKNTDLVDSLSETKETLESQKKQLENSLSLVRATLESTTDGILVVNANNKIEDFNLKFLKMWKLSANQLKKRDIKSLTKLVMDKLINAEIFIDKFYSLTANSEEVTFDELIFKDGKVFERYSYPQRVGHQSVGRVWTFRDITERKSMETKLFHQANFDSLTGLPNRSLFRDRAAQTLLQAKALKLKMAVLFLDLDRFKLINDSLGHIFADKLLIKVSERLIECVGPDTTVSREGGDEFVIILNSIKNETEIMTISNNILQSIRQPFFIDEHKLTITTSIGISFFPRDGEESGTLIRNADIAMYHAKVLGRNNFQFYTEEMNKKVKKRVLVESQLRDALAQNEFALAYQPIFNIKTGKIICLEALLRWRRPKNVIIYPDEFISLAEETGEIVAIGEWVLSTACIAGKKWHDEGFTDLQIAVNVSAKQFKEQSFLENIKKTLYNKKFNPNFLSLELTESTIMEDVEKAIDIFHQLKILGVSIIIDDFGTGYSSLSYLKRLPVDKLKIDRSFIKDIPKDSDDAAITDAIIALGNSLNLKVVAEGVETKKQLDFLIQHQCDEVQGFYFSEPLNESDCIEFLQRKYHSQ